MGSMIAGLALSFFKAGLGPFFNWLNARADSDKQIHLVDTNALVTISAGGQAAASKADEIMGKVRLAEGNWGPTVIFMASVLAPLVWHEWQVVLDSSRWLPAIGWTGYGFVPYPTVDVHIIGSWKVAALPGVWEATEQAIFSSLFIGASAALGTVAAIGAWGKHIRK